jgi:hypothetical protein
LGDAEICGAADEPTRSSNPLKTKEHPPTNVEVVMITMIIHFDGGLLIILAAASVWFAATRRRR